MKPVAVVAVIAAAVGIAYLLRRATDLWIARVRIRAMREAHQAEIDAMNHAIEQAAGNGGPVAVPRVVR